MKNVRFASLMLLALLPMASAQYRAAPISENQSQNNELVHLSHEWIDAINAKDRPALDRLMAPDFLLRGWDGSWQVERARWLDNLFHVIDIQTYSHSAISAQVFGDVGAVTSNWYWRGVRGTDAKKPFEEHGYVVDVWRRDAGHWQVVSRTSVVLPGKEEPPKRWLQIAIALMTPKLADHLAVVGTTPLTELGKVCPSCVRKSPASRKYFPIILRWDR